MIDSTYILRPSNDCVKSNEEYITECLGLPSGHAEITTIISYLLFKYKYISLYLAFILVILVGFQRLYTQKHNFIQVSVGTVFGLFYGYLYFKTGLSITTMALILFFICMLVLILLFIIDYKVYNANIPSWVDPSLFNKIKDKQNANLLIKLLSVTAPAYKQDLCLFIDWNFLENKLNDIVNQIKTTNITYDAVVGIKTGGAIISDYISNKLGLPNYKIKVSTVENKCNKTDIRSIKSYYEIYYLKNNKEYVICEEIHEKLSGKKIILIDESVASGGTIIRSIDYLLDEKKVSDIYACCIFANKDINYRNIKLHLQKYRNESCLVWPWGYDN